MMMMNDGDYAQQRKLLTLDDSHLARATPSKHEDAEKLGATAQPTEKKPNKQIVKKEMSTTTSKLGKKYDRKQIEKLDKQFHSELRKMFRKSNCADCGKKHPNWATLKRGKFVCINCAQKLRADSSNRVKSCMGTYLWHPDEMEVMREGCKSS